MKAIGCSAQSTALSITVGSLTSTSSIVADAISSPLFHQSGIVWLTKPPPENFSATGCAGANHEIDPSVGSGCSSNDICSGKLTALSYSNVVTIAKVICVVESPSRIISIPSTMKQLIDASPSSPLDSEIESLHWSTISLWSMFSHIALANNSVSCVLRTWSLAIAFLDRFLMLLESSEGREIWSFTTKYSPTEISIFLIFERSG